MDAAEGLQCFDEFRLLGLGGQLGQQRVKPFDPRGRLIYRLKALLQHSGLGRMVEDLLLDPLDMAFGPVAIRPSAIVAQKKLRELVAGS